MKTISWTGRTLGALCLAGALSLLTACGSDQAPAGTQVQPPRPPPPPPPIIVSFEPNSYVLAPEERLSVVAQVSGTATPVSWALNCESGQASMVPNGNSATITALSGGNCFLWASEGQVSAVAIVRIPPLAAGDSCTDDSQCGQGAPRCAHNAPPCGKTCTLACTTDADCPVTGAFGAYRSCTNGLCKVVTDPDWSCP